MTNTEEKQTPGAILAAFLESTPPGMTVQLTSPVKHSQTTGNVSIDFPEITLHCTHPDCNGRRKFRKYQSGAVNISAGHSDDEFIAYMCSNCQRRMKTYAISIHRPGADPIVRMTKYGEFPAFGPNTPAKVLRLLQADKDLFLQGRKSEVAGLGIGAFSYYRRVVDNQKDRIFDAIIEASRKLQASEELIADLEAARGEKQFEAAVDRIKHGLPSALLIDGHNPLKILYSALSDGLHARTDSECLEDAVTIRLVLTELAQRVSEVLQDNAALSDAVAKLNARKERRAANAVSERAENEKLGRPADADLDVVQGSADAPPAKT
jgi:hypothetical protein